MLTVGGEDGGMRGHGGAEGGEVAKANSLKTEQT